MSYSKLSETIPGIAEAAAAAMSQAGVSEPVFDALLAAGSAVLLETGDTVWVSCVVHDRPETPQVDFITVALACKDGAPWAKPNGQFVAQVFWHGLWVEPLATLGIDTVRRALMMIALGEPQPQVPIPSPDPEGPTEQDAIPLSDPTDRSIRKAITAALEIASPVADVL